MFLLDDHANVGQSLSQLSGITEDFVPELHDIPIGIVNACLYQNVDGLGLWEEEEKHRSDDNDSISNQSTIEGGEEGIESPDTKSNIKTITTSLSVIIFILLNFYLLDIHLEILKWFIKHDS